MSTVLDGLPRSSWRSLVARLAQAYGLYWLAVVVTAIVSVLTHTETGSAVAVIAVLSGFAMHVVFAVTGGILQSIAKSAFRDGRDRSSVDRPGALAAVSRALRIGLQGEPYLRAWIIVATAAEDSGDFASAAEALRRGITTTRWFPQGSLTFVEARLRRAFACASIGALDDAESELLLVPQGALVTRDLQEQLLRAQALLLYKRGRFREVVDLANASAPPVLARDRALLDALVRSSMLRLDGGAPMRIADTPEHDEWVDRVAPELRARQ